MTDVSSKEAVVLAYLARHRGIDAKERLRLTNILHGPAHELAEKISSPVQAPKKKSTKKSALSTKKAAVKRLAVKKTAPKALAV